MEAAASSGVGRAVYEAIAGTRRVVSTNTNLGMVLLIAPLAAVPPEQPLSTWRVGNVLQNMTSEDCRLVYEAIALARPGGLGQVESMDVAAEPPASLLAAMQAAAGRDQVAQEYATNFSYVLETLLPQLVEGRARGWSLTDSVIHTHVTSIARRGDSLISRKGGEALSARAAEIAAQVLKAGQPGEEAYYESLADFDFWLRSDGNRRNPGATADLIAAALFAALRDERLPPPWQ
jgi:triphosphoribosyl-dephospho-CoA synthase